MDNKDEKEPKPDTTWDGTWRWVTLKNSTITALGFRYGAKTGKPPASEIDLDSIGD